MKNSTRLEQRVLRLANKKKLPFRKGFQAAAIDGERAANPYSATTYREAWKDGYDFFQKITLEQENTGALAHGSKETTTQYTRSDG